MHPPTPVSGGDRSANLELLGRLAEGEWDLNLRLGGGGSDAEAARLLNRIFEKLAAALTESTLCGVNLYANVPQLFVLAEKLEAAAHAQAGYAGEIARSSGEMAGNLHQLTGSVERAVGCTGRVGRIVAELETGSKQIEEVVALVRRIAAQTKLLSLNASVEAARAGAHGRAFAVVADEVQRLAERAAAATDRIGEVLSLLGEKIGEAVAAVGVEGGKHPAGSEATLTGLMEQMAARVAEQAREVTGVAHDIGKIVEQAEQQSQGATRLKSLAAHAREGSDALIVSLGVFRLPAHLKPRELIAHLAVTEAFRGMQRAVQEGAMARAVAAYPFVELLYITDAHGRQVTCNVAGKKFTAAYGSTGHGKDWSQRPWFREPSRTGELYTSDIYRSAASDRFCFTVSAPLHDDRGGLAGVLGADIDLSQLL